MGGIIDSATIAEEVLCKLADNSEAMIFMIRTIQNQKSIN